MVAVAGLFPGLSRAIPRSCRSLTRRCSGRDGGNLPVILVSCRRVSRVLAAFPPAFPPTFPATFPGRCFTDFEAILDGGLKRFGRHNFTRASARLEPIKRVEISCYRALIGQSMGFNSNWIRRDSTGFPSAPLNLDGYAWIQADYSGRFNSAAFNHIRVDWLGFHAI